MSSWGFFSNITLEEASQILKDKGKHGSYLCRRSKSSPGSYTLCVKRKEEIWNFRIINDGESFELYEDDGFASVPDLLEFFQNNPSQFTDTNGHVVTLIEPLIQEDAAPSIEQERWYFGEISKQEAESFLKLKGEHGSYLIRESRSQPGDYVLSVRKDCCMTEFVIEYSNHTFDIKGAKKLKFKTINDLIQYYKIHSLMTVEDEEVVLLEPLCDTAERLKNVERIKREFGWLQTEDRGNTNTKNEGSRPENRGKNRYKNILPFDHTRVILRNSDPSIPGSDYINASYIFDDESGGLFIASQGCVKATVNDFWYMVYQENTRIIIMVTNEVEKAKIKCVRYWPDLNSSMIVDNKQITNTGETVTRDYVVRQLEIQTESETGRKLKTARKIFHYQFIGWPDHGVPNEPGSLLEMMQLIEATQKTFEYPGPPVIHCSAGIGRTGTVVVISMLMSTFRIKGHLEERDIPRTVQKVRLQRSGMVQTEAQYCFIYNAVVFYMETVICRQKHESVMTNNLYGNLDLASAHLDNVDLSEDAPELLPRSNKNRPVPKAPR